MAPKSERWTVRALLALALVSGGVALAYEVLWTRELLNLLGSTTRASAVVLASFMAGLALGAWLAGWWSERLGRPLRLFAAAEVLLAAFGFTFPETFERLGDALLDTDLATGILIALLVMPALLMGVALPALAAALQGHGAAHPRHIAWLYGLNTLGGGAAVLAVGFVVLPAFGLAVAEEGTALAGLLVGGAATALGLRRSPAVAATVEPVPRATGSPLARDSALLVVALALSGVAALGYEVLWTRILVLVVGSSTNAFTLMLGLYLFGLALGGGWIGRYLGRLGKPLVAFQHLQIAVAVAVLVGAAIFGYLPGFALFGFENLGTSPWSIAAVNGIAAAVVILPPTILIGASLPVAARLMERRAPRRGRELGAALALITAGNVIGVLVTAFAVIPVVGLQRGVALLALLNLAAAFLLWTIEGYRAGKRAFAVPGVALAAGLSILVIPSWDVAVMTSGVFRQAPIYLALLGGADRLERAFAAYRTLYYREGSEAVVAVFDRPNLEGPPHRVLTIDGKVDASTGSDMATQVLSGHLPFVFRPDARNALVVGLASGVTVGALAQHPVERIDVIEIEPSVVEASRAFERVNGSPLRDPRVRVTIEDGRRYLQTSPGRFDVIVSEPSNPWLSMSARLFTREFFELARGRLTRRGVLVQWIPLYGLSTPQFKALLRTLLSVFPNVALFHVAEGDLVAVASPQPISVRPEAVTELFEGEIMSGMRDAGVRSPADLLARWVADADGLTNVLGRGPLNTDDNGLLEFGSPWYLLADTTASNLSVIDRAGASSVFSEAVVDAWLPRADGAALWEAIARRHLAARRPALVRGLAKSLRSRGRRLDADLLLGDAADAEGRWGEAAAIWGRQEAPVFWARRAKAAFRKGDVAEVVRLLARTPALERLPEDNFILALALAGTGNAEEALKVLESVRAEGASATGILTPFVKSALLDGLGETERALLERRKFEAGLDGLRRCLEIDGCRGVIDSVIGWSRTAPPGISSEGWDEFRQTLFVRVTRPLPLYLRGVRKLWLGEDAAARRSLRTYLKLLPRPDPASRAHELMALAGPDTE